jgi:hypothetical protein
MSFRAPALAWAISLLFALAAPPAQAILFEAGGEVAMLSSSPEHGGTTTFVPFAGAGFELPRDFAVLGELGLLDYSVTKSGSRANLKLSEGTIAIQGTSLAAVGLKKIDRIEARFGFGIVQYHYANELGSSVTSTLTAGGYTNVFESVKDATGQQVLLGADFRVSPHFLVGAEFRSVTVQPKVDVGLTLGSTSASATGTANLSHTWLGLRALYGFSS